MNNAVNFLIESGISLAFLSLIYILILRKETFFRLNRLFLLISLVFSVALPFVHLRVYEKIGGYNTNFKIALDYDFFYRALKAKCSVSFQKDYVAIMGGSGISSKKELLKYRINEEYQVQKINEENIFWKMVQMIFHKVYFPYKTALLPRFKI